MKNEPTVLSGMAWGKHLRDHNLTSKKQEEIYVCTHNYIPIYKLGDYYFSFSEPKGYKNLTACKRMAV